MSHHCRGAGGELNVTDRFAAAQRLINMGYGPFIRTNLTEQPKWPAWNAISDSWTPLNVNNLKHVQRAIVKKSLELVKRMVKEFIEDPDGDRHIYDKILA